VRLLNRAGVEARSFATGEEVELAVGIVFHDRLDDYTVGFLLRDRLGNEVFGTNTTYLGVPAVPGRPGETVEARFRLRLDLGYGHYATTVAVHSPSGHVEENHDWIDNALAFQVIPDRAYRFAGVASLAVAGEISPANPAAP
jgi:lipopolysaccharide transport system ATP-binding protein